MPISPDVLASTLVDLAPGYSELFYQWHPVTEKILGRGGVKANKLQGPYREFTVIAGGPGQVTHVLTGNEVIAGGRNQQASRGNEYAPRLIYAFDVPRKDLAEADGEMDLAEILKAYPEVALMEFSEMFATQLVNGGSADVGGFLTLNGDTTYNPNGAARTGIFQFATPATQNATVHGIVKPAGAGGVAGWYNQYGNCTSFATNGRRTMREVYARAASEGKVMSAPDIMLADETSYHNYIEDLDEQVQVPAVTGDKTPARVREGVAFLQATLYWEPTLDPTVFAAGVGRDGVIYVLNTDSWELFYLSASESGDGRALSFEMVGRIPDQDMIRYEIVSFQQPYCKQLRANGVIEGTSTP